MKGLFIDESHGLIKRFKIILMMTLFKLRSRKNKRYNKNGT